MAAGDGVGRRTPTAPAEDRDSLYAGIAGLAPVLAEIAQYRAADRRRAGPRDAGRRPASSAQASVRTEPSLYDGLAGDVTALKLLAPGSEPIALQRLAELRTPAGWNTTIPDRAGRPTHPLRTSCSGTAGVVLAAVWAGGEHADDDRDHRRRGPAASRGPRPRPAWTGGCCRVRRRRVPNYSHGTAGIATALAIAGRGAGPPGLRRRRAPGRPAPARRGVAGRRRVHRAAHHPAVHARRGAGDLHLVPRAGRNLATCSRRCRTPAWPRSAASDVAELRQRCLHSILASGVPQRLRPGFWDNDGRCCGTAGVGDVLLDAAQDSPDPARADDAPAGRAHDGRRPRRARDPRPGRRTLAVRGAPPGPAAAATRHLVDAGRRRHRRVPAAPGPGHPGRARRPGGRPPRPVVGGPDTAAHRPHRGIS